MAISDTRDVGIGRREFDDFRRVIHDVSGIALGDNKDALLAARVARRMRALELRDHADYLELVLSDGSGEEMGRLIDAVSTNVTSFFREPTHFDTLAHRVREAAASGATQIRLWSAACSTGEEPYTMAMVASDALEGHPAHIRILATDISGEALERARRGRYDAEKALRIPQIYLKRHLRRGDNGCWEVTDRLRRSVTFARINLSAPPFPMAGPFDAIMCRNVMIYFGRPTRQRLITELERLLAPGGLLMLGHAESLAGLDSDLRTESPAVYRKAEGSR